MNTTYNITVDQAGKGDVTTIQEALTRAPKDNTPYTIYIHAGRYIEKLHITRPNTHLVGHSKTDTVISFTSANGLLAKDGKIWATYNSYVLNADAENITIQSLTIENTFDFLANQRKAANDPTKVTATQAVAMLVGENGHHIECKDSSLISFQDTLYISAGCNYFESVNIWGTVDFIFGGGTALFNHCRLVSRWRDDVHDDSAWGYVAAPSTHIDDPFGFVFLQCRLEKENACIPTMSYKLGRPWHPTTQFDDGFYAHPLAIGHCAFIECQIDDHIDGWDKMHGRDRNGETTWFYAEDSRFHTYNNLVSTGSNAVAPQFELSAEQRKAYTEQTILGGWRPTFINR